MPPVHSTERRSRRVASAAGTLAGAAATAGTTFTLTSLLPQAGSGVTSKSVEEALKIVAQGGFIASKGARITSDFAARAIVQDCSVGVAGQAAGRLADAAREGAQTGAYQAGASAAESAALAHPGSKGIWHNALGKISKLFKEHFKRLAERGLLGALLDGLVTGGIRGLLECGVLGRRLKWWENILFQVIPGLAISWVCRLLLPAGFVVFEKGLLRLGTDILVFGFAELIGNWIVHKIFSWMGWTGLGLCRPPPGMPPAPLQPPNLNPVVPVVAGIGGGVLAGPPGAIGAAAVAMAYQNAPPAGPQLPPEVPLDSDLSCCQPDVTTLENRDDNLLCIICRENESDVLLHLGRGGGDNHCDHHAQICMACYTQYAAGQISQGTPVTCPDCRRPVRGFTRFEWDSTDYDSGSDSE